MRTLINPNQRRIIVLFFILTIALWAAILFNSGGENIFGKITSSIVIGAFISSTGFLSSRGLDWDVLTKISTRTEYDIIFAPGDKISTHWAISRLSYLLLLSIGILLVTSGSENNGQNWLFALTTATTIVLLEVALEFAFSDDDRGIEIGPPFSYTYAGVSEKPRTISEIQQCTEKNLVQESVKHHLDKLEEWDHIESKEISGQQVWWKK